VRIKFGNLLRECRELASPSKLTLKAVGEALLVDISSISRIERGYRAPHLSREQLQKLTNLFREHSVPEQKIQELMNATESRFLGYVSSSKTINDL